MKQLTILALVFACSACLASISWGQHYHSGGYRHGGWNGYRGSGTTVVVGIGSGYRGGGYGGWGYGYRPYYPPARVNYYGGSGYPIRAGYYRPVYAAPGCGYPRPRGGVYIGW
jgi:hypothetical protein